MTGDNMKAELLAPSYCRMAHHRKESNYPVSNIDGQTENGGAAANMTLCVSDNLKCSKIAEFSKLLSSQLERGNDGSIGEGKTNEEPKLSKEESQETRHLKELLLLHLDLIQQQQDLLLMKDRQLQQLTQDKETLRCRLERMERRMSLLRHTGSRGDAHTALTDSPSATASPVPPPAPTTPQSAPPARGIKRKHSLEPQSLVKKFATIARNEYDRSRQQHQPHPHLQSQEPEATLGKRESLRTPRALRISRESQSEQDETSSQSSRHSTQSSRSSTQSSSKNKTKITVRKATKRKAAKRKHIPKDDTIMRTDVMYYVPHEEIVPAEISPKKPDKDEVLVPTFRIKQVPRGYTMEGTENLGDEVYLKRHQKPEREEVRRKRWDLQRLREQKALERLQTSRSYRNDASGPREDDDFETFLPDPDNIEYIEVCDEIPVSAFGFPLPKLEEEEFSVPWFDLERRQREEKCKLRSRKR